MKTATNTGKILKLLILAAVSLLFISCRKTDEWLDIKRRKADVVPRTGVDLQALLDNNNIINNAYPVMGQVGADNFFIPDDRLNSVSLSERNAYLWKPDLLEGSTPGDFSAPNIKIMYANIVLERLDHAPDLVANQREYNNIKGQALFLRGFATYCLAQLFCKAYDPATAAADAGLQLRTISDPNQVSPRSSVQQTYDRILADLQEAAALLPVKALYTSRSSRTAAYALLAKVHLVMGNYQQALDHAELALQTENTLLDFNSDFINPSGTYRFPPFSVQNGNPEFIFYAEGISLSSTNPALGVSFAEPLLYDSYHDDDLRKTIFFRKHANGFYEPVGRYTGATPLFAGLAVNELYLIRAECRARAGDYPGAKDDLNLLLEKRYKSGTFVPLDTLDHQDVLATVLAERRKELALTGQIRWEDLRRLNRDPKFAKTLTHQSGNVSYELPPNDKRYVFPFPDLEVQISNVAQNER